MIEPRGASTDASARSAGSAGAGVGRPAHRLRAVLLTLLLIAPLFGLSYRSVVDRLPVGTRTWAQADRLALAMRFAEPGRGLLEPATYSLFDPGGETAVELPLQEWTAAQIAALPGAPDVVTVFRLLDIALFALGLVFLTLLTARFTASVPLAILPAAILATSPLLVRYSGTFLPDPAAFALYLVGLERLFAFLESRHGSRFAVAMIPLTLAAHVKMSFALYLPGIGLHALAAAWRRDGEGREVVSRRVVVVLASLAASLATLVAGYWYIRRRQALLGSWTFTTRLRPFEDLAELAAVTRQVVVTHTRLVHEPWVLGALAAGLAVVLLLRSISSPRVLLLQWVHAIVAGLTIYLLLGGQYEHHDYYLLACAYPSLALTGVVVAQRLDALLARRRGVVWRSVWLLPLLALLITVPTLVHRLDVQRRAGWLPDPTWVEGAGELLDSIGVPGDAPVVVYFDGGPNAPLVHLERPGYVVHQNQRDRRQVGPAELASFMERHGVRWLVMPADEPSAPSSFRDESLEEIARDDRAKVLTRRSARPGAGRGAAAGGVVGSGPPAGGAARPRPSDVRPGSAR